MCVNCNMYYMYCYTEFSGRALHMYYMYYYHGIQWSCVQIPLRPTFYSYFE